MVFKFYVQRGRWYFKKIEMEAGADTLLDYLADGEEELELDIRVVPFDGSSILKYQNISEVQSGAYYYVEHYRNTRLDLLVWISDSFIFLFDEFKIPPFFHFSKVNK